MASKPKQIKFQAHWVLDVSTAFYNAEEDEIVYVEPPQEWKRLHGEGYLWRVFRVMPGRRKGALLWIDHAAGLLKQLGFQSFEPTPYFFYNPEADAEIGLYMDDIHFCADKSLGPAIIGGKIRCIIMLAVRNVMFLLLFLIFPPKR